MVTGTADLGALSGSLGTWVLSLGGGTLTCDRAARRLLALGDQRRLAFADVATNVHEADRGELAAVLEDLSHGAPEGPVETRCRVVHPGGAIRWIELTGAAFGAAAAADGRPTLIAGTVRDVTARVESEHGLRAQRDQLQDRTDKLSLALAAADMGVWEYCIATGVSRPDRRVSAMFGLKHADEIPVGQLLAAIHPEDRPAIEAAVARVTAGEEETYRQSFRIAHPDGTVRWLDGLGRVTRRDAEGRPLLLSGVNLDVTLSRLQAERNRLLTDELRHRVKNLFSVVIALVRVSARGAPGLAPAFGALADRIAALSRAYDVTQGELGAGDGATGEAGRGGSGPGDGPHAPTAGTLGAVVGDILAPYRDGPGFAIEAEGEEIALDAGVATALGLLVHELVTNAIKHGALSGTGGRIEVRWRVEDDTVHFEWTEHGAPAPVPATERRAGFGSRLIAMAEAQLGGRVSRDWTPGGLAFRLSFPRASADAAPPRAPLTAAE